MPYDYNRQNASAGPGLTSIEALDANPGDVIVAEGEDDYTTQATTTAGRTILTFADPGADRLLFWDESANTLAPLQLGAGLLISDTTLAVDSADASTLSGNNAAYYLNRTNHTGTQDWATLTGTPTTVAGYGITNALVTTNNLSDVGNAATARTNLSVYSIAQVDALLADYQATDEKGQANGYASLGPDGKVPSAQLPIDGSYLGTWNANTNSPAIASGTGTGGDFYIVGTAGATNIDGISSWSEGDQIRFNGADEVWERIPAFAPVTSVNGASGVVVLDPDDLDDTSTTNKFATAAELTKLGGIEALADVTDATNVAAAGAIMDGDFGSNGMMARTAAGTYASRTLTAPAAGITVTNGTGQAGNPTLDLANDLAALEALSSTGIAVRSASDTWVQRTLTGTANEITVTNGNGVSGNPTLSLPSTISFSSKTISGDFDFSGTPRSNRTTGGPAMRFGGGNAMISSGATGGPLLARAVYYDTTLTEYKILATTTGGWGALRVLNSGLQWAGASGTFTAGDTVTPSFLDVVLSTATQTLTNKTLTSPTINNGTLSLGSGTLVLPQATSPSQTAEGSISWDTDDDKLTVGTGSGRKTLVDTDSSQTLSNKLYNGVSTATLAVATDSIAARSLADHFAVIIDVRNFGATGAGSVEVSEWLTGGDYDRGYANLAAIQVDYPHVSALTDKTDWAAFYSAITYANTLTYRNFKVPMGNYYIDAALPKFTGTDLSVCGDGPGSRIILGYNGPVFVWSITGASRGRGLFSGIQYVGLASGTYNLTSAIHIESTDGTGGLSGVKITQNICLGMNDFVLFDDPGRNLWDGVLQIGNIAFIAITDNLVREGSQAAKYGIRFKGAGGPHNIIHDNIISCDTACIQMGNNAVLTGIGDTSICNNHLLGVTSTYGIDIQVKTGETPALYNQNLLIADNQFDGGMTNTVRLRGMSNFRGYPNSSTASVGWSLTDCQNYIYEDRGSFYASYVNGADLSWAFDDVTLSAADDMTLAATDAMAITSGGTMAITPTGTLTIGGAGAVIINNGITVASTANVLRRSTDTANITLNGGSDSSAGALLELYGPSHATLPSRAYQSANRHIFRSQDATTTYLDINPSSGSAVFSLLPRLPSYTVAGLPTGSAGDLAYASNGRKNGEGAGAGTGVMVFKDGSAWRAVDTGATVAA